jgi:WD40 repeat protein
MHVAFTPNGKYVTTSSTDGTVRFWDPKTFGQVALLNYQTSVESPFCFTADGKTLVTVSVDGFLQYNSLNPAQAGKAAPAPKAKKRRR